tara:strand:+ start:76 stop:705 length:630 start_codon:yes stop_codon:yes gene_type:complete
VKLNLSTIINTLKDVKGYLFPVRRLSNKFKKINSTEELQVFIQERSAHVTQTTLYGYIKTRIGSRYAMMFEDKKFSESINIAKWNIYVSCLSDCTAYAFSYLIDLKNLKQNDAEKIFLSIIQEEKKNGLDAKVFEEAKLEFQNKIRQVDWKIYHKTNPFTQSGLALYKWSPIAEELKILDKKIVLNSIKLKWNLVENEFKELTKNLNFN